MPQLSAMGHSSLELSESVASIIEETQLAAIATCSAVDSSPWINTAYYASDDAFNFYWLSEPHSKHSRNILENRRGALAIFNSQQSGVGGKRGLQIIGASALATGEHLSQGLRAYQKRYSGFENTIRVPEDFDKGIIQSKLYVLAASMIKIFDEPRFGEEIWIEATVLK